MVVTAPVISSAVAEEPARRGFRMAFGAASAPTAWNAAGRSLRAGIQPVTRRMGAGSLDDVRGIAAQLEET